jgi:formylglycine-generating enzyme required for sulfatase activity
MNDTPATEQAQRFGQRFAGSGKPPGGLSPARIAFAVFAVLALGVVYVIAASPLRVQLTPEAETVSVRGFLPAVPFGDRYLVFPGSYVVEAEREGYRQYRQNVSVPYGGSATLTAELQKLPGRLRVTTPPVEGARLFVDGVESGASPATLEIDAGEREIRAVAERYLPAAQRLTIEGVGRLQTLEIALQPAWGRLAVGSLPDRAKVRLDGNDIGEAPLTLEALQGTHTLEFTKEGWKPATRTIEIRAGQSATLPAVELERIDGTLALRSEPAGAQVLINGQFRGQTPLSLALVGERDYLLNLSKAGYESAARSVRVEGGGTTRLSLVLPPEFGTVFLTTNPPGATLSVNGQPSGSATQRLSLQTVPQALEITLPGYETYRTTLTPQRGVARRLDVTLKTAGEALRERTRDLTTRAGQKLVLVYIGTPARFTVGAPRRDAARRSNEVEYPVELTRSFLMSEKEVTNAEFRKFRTAHNSGLYQTTSLNGDDQPAVNVSWEDAARYANWLSEQEGLAPAYREQDGKVMAVTPLSGGYRLPTEAEWEFVARYDGGQRPADQPRLYPWGDSLPPPRESGNFAHDGSNLPFAIPGYVDPYLASAPVGKFAPNASLVYDLGGNVAEWCHDFYDVPAPGGAVRVDPAGPASGRFHVIKGASWRSGSATELRLSYRDYAEKPRDDLGFRVVRYVDATP